MSIPIIDVSPLVQRTPGQDQVARQIHDACREAGFFYITGHGIDNDLQETLEHQARQFFHQGQDDKEKISMSVGGRAWRGYFKVGDELTSGKPDLKEGLYFGSELSHDDPRVKAGLPMHGQNLFPEQLPGFREAVLQYLEAMTELGHALMRGISLSLGLKATHFQSHFTGRPLTLFRIFRYPPADPPVNDQWGVGEHTDYGVLTNTVCEIS